MLQSFCRDLKILVDIFQAFLLLYTSGLTFFFLNFLDRFADIKSIQKEKIFHI